MTERIEFSRPAGELSCIVGNLFAELDPPCGVSGGRGDVLTIFGRTRADGGHAVLRVYADRCVYTGPPEALKAAMGGHCPEEWRCGHG